MQREIYAKIIVDDDRAIEENMGTLDYFEREFGWLEQSGIALEYGTVLDEDSDNEWERYCKYLMEWTINNMSDYNKGMSPASFEEWMKADGALDHKYYFAYAEDEPYGCEITELVPETYENALKRYQSIDAKYKCIMASDDVDYYNGTYSEEIKTNY